MVDASERDERAASVAALGAMSIAVWAGEKLGYRDETLCRYVARVVKDGLGDRRHSGAVRRILDDLTAAGHTARRDDIEAMMVAYERRLRLDLGLPVARQPTGEGPASMRAA